VNPILFTSREFDAETGLYYNRARYLDPTTGRWTTQDPLGFAAGDANLYRYVGNTPTMLVDPSGYIWSWAAAGIGAGIGAVVGTVGYLGFNAITGRPITWGGVAGAAAGGAVAGGIAGGFVGAATGDPSALVVIGGGVLIGAGSGAAGGFTSSVVSQGIDQGRIDWGQVAVDTGTGAVIGGVTGGALGGGKVLLRPRPGVVPNDPIDPNKLHHIFGKPQHNLGQLLNQFGGNQQAAYQAVQNAAQAAVQQQGIAGVFEIVVNVGGVNVTVRGNVINGVVHIGTFFVR